MRIKIEKSSVRNLSSDITLCTEKFRLLIHDLENESKRLSSYWNEASAITFFNIIYEQYIVKLNSYIKVLDKYNEYLLNSVSFYEKLETTFSQKKIDV